MGDSFKPIDKMQFWCQKVLPLAYDDSLSYYEFLCKVCTTLNLVIEDINLLPDFIRELVSDERLKEILSELLDQLREQIAKANEGVSKTATANRKIGDLVWLNGLLYKVTHNMIAGDQYVENSNCVKVTIEEQMKVIYHIDEELLEMNGIVDGTQITAVGDTHVYDGATQEIRIIPSGEVVK